MNYRVEHEGAVLADSLPTMDAVNAALEGEGLTWATPGVRIYRDEELVSRAALDFMAELRYAEGV